ncbi:MAG: hypothetical protein AABY46_01125 [Nitrospirota bacterium]
MRVPNDPGLFFTVFLSICLAVILTSWLLLPVYHKESEETTEGEPASVKLLAAPDELIRKAESVIIRAEAALKQLTADQKDTQKKPALSKPKGGS